MSLLYIWTSQYEQESQRERSVFRSNHNDLRRILRLENEEFDNLYSSPNIIRQIKSRRMRWAGHMARMGEERKVYRVLMKNPEGKRPLGRPKRRWDDGIRMDLREIGWGWSVFSWLRIGAGGGLL
jgi:hypothetical protein